jgi:hypothetical protein
VLAKGRSGYRPQRVDRVENGRDVYIKAG